MIRNGTAAGPVSIVQCAVMPRSIGGAFVLKRSILDTLSNGIDEIERDATASRQHVRIDSPTKRLAELDSDVPPCVVQVCQGGIHTFADLCRGFRRPRVNRRTPHGPSASLGESAHRMRVLGRGDFHLYPDQASIRPMAPNAGCGLIAVSGNIHGVIPS